MNYRVTIEAVSEEAKKEMPETVTAYLDCVLLAGNYDPTEFPEESPQHSKTSPDAIGQVSALLGRHDKCVEAFHQFMRSLPDDLKASMLARALAEKMGIRTSQTIACMKVEPEREGASNLDRF